MTGTFRSPMDLYPVSNPQETVSQLYSNAMQSTGAMQKKTGSTTTVDAPGLTAGGALSAGAGMGMAGAYLGAEGMLGASITGPIGLGLGALLGIGAYLLS